MRNAPLIFVTGLSGAGMSSALNVLQDIGYEVLDNFPISLIEPLLKDNSTSGTGLALGIDSRTRGFDVDRVISVAREKGATLLFLSAEEAALQKRFNETRRKHPMATDRPINDGIRKELILLESLRDAADITLDTTDYTVHDLRHTLNQLFADPDLAKMVISIVSFGYKYGLPRDADMVFDMRFLRNPYWEEDLRPLTGLNQDVGVYVQEDPAYADFIHNLQGLLGPLLDRYGRDGKKYFTLAFGCTGGKHRSVFVAETIAQWLKGPKALSVHITHRDMKK